VTVTINNIIIRSDSPDSAIGLRSY